MAIITKQLFRDDVVDISYVVRNNQDEVQQRCLETKQKAHSGERDIFLLTGW